MVEGLAPRNRKKINFGPLNDNFWVHFDAVFNRQKPWGTDFTVQSRNAVQKISKNLRSPKEGGGHTIVPSLNTSLLNCFHQWGHALPLVCLFVSLQ